MTIHRSQDRLIYWRIEVLLDGVEAYFEEHKLLVSAKGYPATRSYARFETRKHAKKFLELNRAEITRRCVRFPKFTGFALNSGLEYPPVKFDLPISLRGVGKRGPSRSSLYKNGVR